MFKHAKRLVTTASAVTVAGLVAVGGLTAASASPARPSLSGIEHFQIVSSSATAITSSVITYGLFTAAGVDFQGQHVDTFKLPGGSFKVTHGRGHGKASFDPRTCLQTISETGPYTVGHGTGKYKGISGHGKYQLSLLLLAARNAKGACSQTKAPLGYQEVIRATGPVRL